MSKNNIYKVSGILEVSKISELNISKETFYKYMKTNNYEKVGPGMYASSDEMVDELFILHKRCPKGIMSHDEALYYYGLIDREPLKHTITIFSGYNASRLNKAGYKIYYVDKEKLNIGKTEVIDNYGNTIPMYDLERTIVDLIRNRSDFEIQDYTTALKAYARRTDKNLNKLSEYARTFRVEKILRTYLEVLI